MDDQLIYFRARDRALKRRNVGKIKGEAGGSPGEQTEILKTLTELLLKCEKKSNGDAINYAAEKLQDSSLTTLYTAGLPIFYRVKLLKRLKHRGRTSLCDRLLQCEHAYPHTTRGDVVRGGRDSDTDKAVTGYSATRNRELGRDPGEVIKFIMKWHGYMNAESHRQFALEQLDGPHTLMFITRVTDEYFAEHTDVCTELYRRLLEDYSEESVCSPEHVRTALESFRLADVTHVPVIHILHTAHKKCYGRQGDLEDDAASTRGTAPESCAPESMAPASGAAESGIAGSCAPKKGGVIPLLHNEIQDLQLEAFLAEVRNGWFKLNNFNWNQYFNPTPVRWSRQLRYRAPPVQKSEPEGGMIVDRLTRGLSSGLVKHWELEQFLVLDCRNQNIRKFMESPAGEAVLQILLEKSNEACTAKSPPVAKSPLNFGRKYIGWYYPQPAESQFWLVPPNLQKILREKCYMNPMLNDACTYINDFFSDVLAGTTSSWGSWIAERSESLNSAAAAFASNVITAIESIPGNISVALDDFAFFSYAISPNLHDDRHSYYDLENVCDDLNQFAEAKAQPTKLRSNLEVVESNPIICFLAKLRGNAHACSRSLEPLAPLEGPGVRQTQMALWLIALLSSSDPEYISSTMAQCPNYEAMVGRFRVVRQHHDWARLSSHSSGFPVLPNLKATGESPQLCALKYINTDEGYNADTLRFMDAWDPSRGEPWLDEELRKCLGWQSMREFTFVKLMHRHVRCSLTPEEIQSRLQPLNQLIKTDGYPIDPVFVMLFTKLTLDRWTHGVVGEFTHQLRFVSSMQNTYHLRKIAGTWVRFLNWLNDQFLTPPSKSDITAAGGSKCAKHHCKLIPNKWPADEAEKSTTATQAGTTPTTEGECPPPLETTIAPLPYAEPWCLGGRRHHGGRGRHRARLPVPEGKTNLTFLASPVLPDFWEMRFTGPGAGRDVAFCLREYYAAMLRDSRVRKLDPARQRLSDFIYVGLRAEDRRHWEEFLCDFGSPQSWCTQRLWRLRRPELFLKFINSIISCPESLCANGKELIRTHKLIPVLRRKPGVHYYITSIPPDKLRERLDTPLPKPKPAPIDAASRQRSDVEEGAKMEDGEGGRAAGVSVEGEEDDAMGEKSDEIEQSEYSSNGAGSREDDQDEGDGDGEDSNGELTSQETEICDEEDVAVNTLHESRFEPLLPEVEATEVGRVKQILRRVEYMALIDFSRECGAAGGDSHSGVCVGGYADHFANLLQAPQLEALCEQLLGAEEGVAVALSRKNSMLDCLALLLSRLGHREQAPWALKAMQGVVRRLPTSTRAANTRGENKDRHNAECGSIYPFTINQVFERANLTLVRAQKAHMECRILLGEPVLQLIHGMSDSLKVMVGGIYQTDLDQPSILKKLSEIGGQEEVGETGKADGSPRLADKTELPDDEVIMMGDSATEEKEDLVEDSGTVEGSGGDLTPFLTRVMKTRGHYNQSFRHLKLGSYFKARFAMNMMHKAIATRNLEHLGLVMACIEKGELVKPKLSLDQVRPLLTTPDFELVRKCVHTFDWTLAETVECLILAAQQIHPARAAMLATHFDLNPLEHPNIHRPLLAASTAIFGHEDDRYHAINCCEKYIDQIFKKVGEDRRPAQAV